MQNLKMFTLFVTFFLTSPGICKKLSIVNEDNVSSLALCVRDIVTRSYEKGTKLTYVDIHSNENKILKVINHMSTHLLISRKDSDKFKIRMPQQGYIICSVNSNEFTNNFKYLRRETTWNP